jgi:hypothetical protein
LHPRARHSLEAGTFVGAAVVARTVGAPVVGGAVVVVTTPPGHPVPFGKGTQSL